MLQAMAGYDPLDPSTVPVPVDDYVSTLGHTIKGLVMGVPSNYFFDPIDREVADTVMKAVAVLEGLGVESRQVEIKYIDQMMKVGGVLELAGSAIPWEGVLRKDRNQMSPAERHWALSGQFLLASDLVRAQQMRRLFQQEWATTMERVDFLVTPTNRCIALSI